jgi:hypothetical protein
MPDLPFGFDLLSRLALHFPQLPVIYVSEDSRKETIIAAFQGAGHFSATTCYGPSSGLPSIG